MIPSLHTTYEWNPDPWTVHPVLTKWVTPFAETFVTKKLKQEVIYEELLYSFDDFGRRSCPEIPADPSFHACFFGGSYTFGDGVEDELTLPCQFQNIFGGEFVSYNLAQNGFGTGQMYFQLSSNEMINEGTPPDGIAIYNFIADHVPRTVGELSRLSRSPYLYDYYLFEIDNNDRLQPPFKIVERAKPNRIVINFRALQLVSPLARFVVERFEFPLLPQETGVRTVAQVIIESKRRYEQKFSGEFFVVLWPRQRLPPEQELVFTNLLRSNGIHVIEIPELENGTPFQIHPLDPHPSPEEYHWVAEHLHEKVLAVMSK